MHNLFFLDTETTSADTRVARIVHVATIWKTEQQEWLINPPCAIETGAMATHHITYAMVESMPMFIGSEACNYILNLVCTKSILVAHNAPFDVAVLANDGIIVPMYIDTLRVARHILDDSTIASFSLQYLRYHYSLDAMHVGELTGGFAHSALYDTIVLKWFYEFLEDRVKKLYPGVDPVGKMLELTHSPVLINTFTFWKWKDRTIESVASHSPDYLDWLLWAEMSKPEHEHNKDMIYTLGYWLKKEDKKAHYNPLVDVPF